MNFLGQLKTVLWSFVGIGGRSKDERHKVNPLAVIVIAFVLVALFLGMVAMAAHYAAS